MEFLSDTVSFELGLLETIGYFVICLSKKVLIFTEIDQNHNLKSWKNITKGEC